MQKHQHCATQRQSLGMSDVELINSDAECWNIHSVLDFFLILQYQNSGDVSLLSKLILTNNFRVLMKLDHGLKELKLE